MTQPRDIFFTSPSPFGSGRGIRVTWLGTAGFAIEHDGHVLLIDPYLTRASLARCVFAPLQADSRLVDWLAPKADAIVLSHTHFDHALDTPLIARRTGARVFGSGSAVHLCRSHGVAESQVQCIEPGSGGAPTQAEVGPFRLRFWPSAHSAFLLGRVPFPGEINDCSDIPMRTQAYRCGAVFSTEIEVAGRRIFHIGSAQLVERSWHVGPIDVALACVAGWTTTERYPERLMSALSPGGVLLHHWDNFLRRFDGPPTAKHDHDASTGRHDQSSEEARPLPGMRFAQLIDRLQSVDRLPVGALPLLGSVEL